MDSGSHRHLYDIGTVAVWTPNDNADQQIQPLPAVSSLQPGLQPRTSDTDNVEQRRQETIDQTARRQLDAWRQWVLRHVASGLSPLFLTTSVPSGLASIISPLRSPWQLALSPDSQLLCVNQDDRVEFRTVNSGYQVVHSVCTTSRPQDLYPKWRRVAWSLDSKLIAKSSSDGTVEIIDTKGALIGTILAIDKPVQELGEISKIEYEKSLKSSIFVEPISHLAFVDLNHRDDPFQAKSRREHGGHIYAYELVTISYDGTLRSYLFNTPETLDNPDMLHSPPGSPLSPGQSENSPKTNKMRNRRSLLSAQSLLKPRKNLWPKEGGNDPGFFCFYHKFSLQPWYRAVTCASIDYTTGILCVGGSLQKDLVSTSAAGTDDAAEPSVQFWALVPEAPFYKKFTAQGNLETSVDSLMDRRRLAENSSPLPQPLATFTQSIQKLFERDQQLCTDSIHTLVSHETYGALTLDCAGNLTMWNLTRGKGGVKRTTWDKQHLNYYARSKEHVDLTFQQLQEVIKEFHSNGVRSEGLIGLDNGKCVSMRFWTKDAILLGYESGVMIVLQIPELINILGEEPKVFASCFEFTNSGFAEHDEQVLVMEEMTRMIRARVVGDRWIMMSEQEDRALGEPTEQEVAKMMGNENFVLRMISKASEYLESGANNDVHRPKRQKLILVPKRTMKLYRMLRVPPEELLFRKLDICDYSAALSIATTYEMNTDIVYQAQWQQQQALSTSVVTAATIASVLDNIKDKEWVLANCLDVAVEDPDSIRALLEYGIQQTERVLDDIVTRNDLGTATKLAWIRAAAAMDQLSEKELAVVNEVELTDREILWCKYRWYFIKYLDRLDTFIELQREEKEKMVRDEARRAKIERPKHRVLDPLDPFSMDLDELSPKDLTSMSSLMEPHFHRPYATFRDIDLPGQAIAFATAEFFEGIAILFKRHNRETWPWRLSILTNIPETSAVEMYGDLLPKVNPQSALEQPWASNHPWRDRDWVNLPEIRRLVFGTEDHELDSYREQQSLVLEERMAAHGGHEAASLDMVTIRAEAEEILPSPTESAIMTADKVTQWYVERAHDIDEVSGQIQQAQQVIQYGRKHNVPGLETIDENLSLISKILYEQNPLSSTVTSESRKRNRMISQVALSLSDFSRMNPLEVVSLCLRSSDQKSFVADIRYLVLPYLLEILPQRWGREEFEHTKGQGLPPGLDTNNPLSYLHAYLLALSVDGLPWVAEVAQASKPVFEVSERVIANDMELSWLTLACMYGSQRLNEWEVMSNMIVCLPMFEQNEPVDEAVDIERRAELRRDIFLESNAHAHQSSHQPKIQHPLGPLEQYPAFVKYAPTPGLMQHALDRLEQHLTAAETLARYDLPVPLSWFLENSDSYQAQLQMVTKLARLASGGPENMGERFESDDEWMLLLEDLVRFRGGDDSNSSSSAEENEGAGDVGNGVLGLVSEQDIYREFLGGLLSCGKFELAHSILFPPGLLPPLRLATAEKLVIDSSVEMYNNAMSGNMNSGLMKMAYDCLKVLPETTSIRREMDLIEATHFLTSTYHLMAASGTLILPAQIRKTSDKLSLVRQLMMTEDYAYRDHKAMLDLAMKLTGGQLPPSVSKYHGGSRANKKKEIEIEVVVMSIEAALKDRNISVAMNLSDQLMTLLKSIGVVDLNKDGTPKVKQSAFEGDDNEEKAKRLHAAKNKIRLSEAISGNGSPMLPLSAGGNVDYRVTKQPWQIFLDVSYDPLGKDYQRRLEIAGFSLTCCPAEEIQNVLRLWDTLEQESLTAKMNSPPVTSSAGLNSFTASAAARGVTGIMSSMMDGRPGSAGPLSTARGGHSDRNSPLPPSTPSRTGSSLSMMSNLSSADHQRKRDKLKSLVSSIWSVGTGAAAPSHDP